MNAGVLGVALLALAVAGWLWWHRDAPRTCTALALVAGVAFAGVLGGTIGAGLARLSGPPPGSPGPLTAGTVMFALVVAGCFVGAFELVIKGLHRRRARPRRWHPWLALVLPTVVIAASVPVLAQIVAVLTGAASHTGDALIHLGGEK
ncbi:MAG: hypothetical protein J2P20_00075 [Pseudonocardia sp.]|nr:hypothetical protein [Pseudonocardia sp.]